MDYLTSFKQFHTPFQVEDSRTFSTDQFSEFSLSFDQWQASQIISAEVVQQIKRDKA
jgi:hypothetical protein